MKGLEKVYKVHHEGRGDGFAILQKERGGFLRRHIQQGKNILDIGCRDGQLTSTYLEGNTVTGVDIDKDALARAVKNFGISTIHADLNDEWNFTDTKFDVVVACEFLEHIYFPGAVIGKVKTLLKPEGLFVGTVPHAFSLPSRIKLFFGIKAGTPLSDPTHINHFTQKEFRALLEEHFEVIEIDTWVPNRYRLFAKVFPYLFAHDLMFAVKNMK